MQRTCVFDLNKQETRAQKFEVEQLKNKDARESRSMDLLGVSKLSQMQTTPNPATHSLCKPAKGLRGPVFKCSEPAEHQLGRPLLISFPSSLCLLDGCRCREIYREKENRFSITFCSSRPSSSRPCSIGRGPC